MCQNFMVNKNQMVWKWMYFHVYLFLDKYYTSGLKTHDISNIMEKLYKNT